MLTDFNDKLSDPDCINSNYHDSVEGQYMYTVYSCTNGENSILLKLY